MDHIEQTGFKHGLPASPWALRFPASELGFVSGNTNHSVLAPVPKVSDPIYYDQDIRLAPIPRTGAEIDKALFSEGLQLNNLYQVSTWEATTLSRYVQFSPNSGLLSGGHNPCDKYYASGLPFSQSTLQHDPFEARPEPLQTNEDKAFLIYERERIKVDETQWFHFFRKDRWMDWVGTENPTVTEKARNWSVENPKIWEFLRLQTMLFGRIEYWKGFEDIFGPSPFSDTDLILLSYPTEQIISVRRNMESCPFDYITTLSSDEWETELERILSNAVWSFADVYPASAVTATAFTEPDWGGPVPLFCLGVKILEIILSTKLTLAELCAFQTYLAIILMHELQHAMVRQRTRVDPRMKSVSGGNFTEPLLNARGYREAGHYMDQHFFGGSLQLPPMAFNEFDSKAILPPISFLIMEWNLEGPAVIEQRRALHSTNLVSSMWMSKILSEFFWQDPACPRKSDRFFHRRTLFEMTERRRYRLRDLPSEPNPEDRVVMEAWEEQQRQLQMNRSLWDHTAVDLWKQSPRASLKWRDISFRMLYQEFLDAFWKSNPGRCMQIARRVFGVWNPGYNLIRESVELRSLSLTPFSMIWQSIALLMMASLPLLKRDQFRFLVRKNTGTTLFKSSRDALAHGRDLNLYMRVEADEYDTLYGPSEFFDLEGVRKDEFTQMDYLDRIQGIFEAMRITGCVLPAQFLTGITNAVTALRADRTAIMKSDPQHTDSWASDWFFTFPVYDTEYVVFDEQYQTWVQADHSLLEMTDWTGAYNE
ncbi:hypothetical protein F4678DRAFT_483140 [Xylaria arbuscula]|nr:hypothetical protein F4678DRAFT_483140 [Xylaria arbuscula]